MLSRTFRLNTYLMEGINQLQIASTSSHWYLPQGDRNYVVKYNGFVCNLVTEPKTSNKVTTKWPPSMPHDVPSTTARRREEHEGRQNLTSAGISCTYGQLPGYKIDLNITVLHLFLAKLSKNYTKQCHTKKRDERKPFVYRKFLIPFLLISITWLLCFLLFLYVVIVRHRSPFIQFVSDKKD